MIDLPKEHIIVMLVGTSCHEKESHGTRCHEKLRKQLSI